MPLRVSKTDLELMTSLAEYRFLSSRQLAFLRERSAGGAMRRLGELEKGDLVQSFRLSLEGRRGRPETLYALTTAGTGLVVEKEPGKMTGLRPPPGRTATAALAHENLINWFRLHLLQVGRTIDGLETAFTPSPLAIAATPAVGGPEGSRRGARKPAGDPGSETVPDGALMIRNSSLGKSLLFLLEADMGTDQCHRARGSPQPAHGQAGRDQGVGAGDLDPDDPPIRPGLCVRGPVGLALEQSGFRQLVRDIRDEPEASG